jgi:hypothetical protein
MLVKQIVYKPTIYRSYGIRTQVEGVAQRSGKNASSSTSHERSQVMEDHRIRDRIKVKGSRPSLYNSWTETEVLEDSKMQWNCSWSRSNSGRNRHKDH